MKRIQLLLLMVLLSVASHAQQTIRPDGMGGWIVEGSNDPNDPCAGQSGFGAGWCRGQQEKMQHQLQQQQIENQRLQNELLRRRLEQEQVVPQAQPQTPQSGNQVAPEMRSWQAANPWFGSDKAKTEFAVLYAKQLKQDRPDLGGRPFLDAVAAKVFEVFGTSQTGQSR